MRSLLEEAKEALNHAYSPYSKFKVGAALLAENGKVYRGCNVENICFGNTMCAERVALHTAVAAGARSFKTIALVADKKVPPCGSCLQALLEFAPDINIVYAAANNLDGCSRQKLSELLPTGFGGDNFTL